jgi:threonine/homoserine/homoserine lactone efflux protein
VTRSAITGRRAQVRIVSLGVPTGCVVSAVASTLGIAAVLGTSAEVYRTLYTELVARLGDLIRRRRVRASIEGATGVTMLALGVAVLVEG